jgi:biotin synthase
MPKSPIFLCAICNISSGSCNEDCAFCTQSVRYGADITRYKEKPIAEIVKEAKAARQNQAIGFCLVTAGKGITEGTLRFVCEAAQAVKRAEPELNIIACNGLATKKQLEILKDHGVGSYNHNLETSESYYEKICTTHRWAERYETCENVKAVGLNLCSGGIFGMGESEADRESLVRSIVSLDPVSIAMNFFHPNSALPLKKSLTDEEALEWIAYMRQQMKTARIMIAGGREITFKENQSRIFEAGANAIVVGNYLTTTGNAPNKDIEMLDALGLKIAQSCDES